MWNKKEEEYVYTYLVYKIKSRTKKIPVWREIETIGTACFQKEMRNNTQKSKKKWEGLKSQLYLFSDFMS